jgi:hypothetical protein
VAPTSVEYDKGNRIIGVQNNNHEQEQQSSLTNSTANTPAYAAAAQSAVQYAAFAPRVGYRDGRYDEAKRHQM